MGKNRSPRHKNQAGKPASDKAESTSAVSSSSDAVRPCTESFEVEKAEAAATRASTSISDLGLKQINKGTETSEAVTRNEIVSEGTERPSIDRLNTEQTNESFVSAPSGDQADKADIPNTGSIPLMAPGSTSDNAAAPEDAGAGPQPRSTEVHTEAPVATGEENQPDLAKVWQPIREEDVPSSGIVVEGRQASRSGPSTTLPSQPGEAKDEIGDGGEPAGAQPLSEERHSDTLVAVDVRAPPQEGESSIGTALDVEKNQGKRLAHEADEGINVFLERLKHSVPDDGSKTDENQREITHSILQHTQRQGRAAGGNVLDTAEGGEVHAGNDEKGWRKAGTQSDEAEIEAEGLPDEEQTMLARLQKELKIQRQRNQELQDQLQDALQTPTRPHPQSSIQASREAEEDLETMGVRPEISRGGVDDLAIGPGGEPNPVTVFRPRYGTARDFLGQKGHVLGYDTQIFKTIASVADYIDGMGDKPSKVALREFDDFRYYTTQRVRVLEEALHGEDPSATMNNFDARWHRMAENNPWGARLELRLATMRAAIHFKHGKDSPQYHHDTMLLQRHLSDLRRRLGEDSEDPIALQMEDIMNTVVQR
ncbi:hypothetical protein VPNG_06551 [Cytospora leucostoma]|uniref:Uncharacterized protein n=1 Tax=Cytospora leucostoma TaxID=1230097 RepID=A0A423X2K5_9PEZI|nr:hypothetical protein VPNG_06551 [Cytospora leucostoma]